MKKEIKTGSFFRGSLKNGREILNAFICAGITNDGRHTGDYSVGLYYVEEDGNIEYVENELFQNALKAQGEEYEITLKDLDEQDLVRSRYPQLLSVLDAWELPRCEDPENGAAGYLLTAVQLDTLQNLITAKCHD